MVRFLRSMGVERIDANQMAFLVRLATDRLAWQVAFVLVEQKATGTAEVTPVRVTFRKIRPKTFCSPRTFLPPSTGLIAVVAIGPIIEAEIEHVSERSELAVPSEA
jgi:hypothetical protein